MHQHLKGTFFLSSVATQVCACVWQLPAALSDCPQITTPPTNRGDTIILCVLQLLSKLQHKSSPKAFQKEKVLIEVCPKWKVFVHKCNCVAMFWHVKHEPTPNQTIFTLNITFYVTCWVSSRAIILDVACRFVVCLKIQTDCHWVTYACPQDNHHNDCATP